MINEKYRELECPCLKLDDELGGYKAARHLIENGHQAIAGFFKRDDLQGVNRLKGFYVRIARLEFPFHRSGWLRIQRNRREVFRMIRPSSC